LLGQTSNRARGERPSAGKRNGEYRRPPTITTQSIKAFARMARKRMRIDGGGYRRDYLRALAQRVEVDAE
jgi:hypothetical protein